MAYAFSVTLGLVVVTAGVVIAVKGRTAMAIALGSAAIWLGLLVVELWRPVLPWPGWPLAFACFWVFRIAAMAIGRLQNGSDRSLRIMALAIGGIVLGAALLALLGYYFYWGYYLAN